GRRDQAHLEISAYSTNHERHEGCAIDDDLGQYKVSVADDEMLGGLDLLVAVRAGVQVEAVFAVIGGRHSRSFLESVTDQGRQCRVPPIRRRVTSDSSCCPSERLVM